MGRKREKSSRGNESAYEPRARGQIVRIRLRNFMCYDDIELRPGAHLNLIIGPNGSGKSTFVCAVILGLGGKLKAIGRADHLNAFVKNGCSRCTIDIELHEPEGENIVVTRKIFSNGSNNNNSEFYVNGTSVAASKIASIREKFNIQIDNLCTVLPQERVQDFAKLNPQQLLDQTQKTLGNADLMETFERLKTIRRSIEENEKESEAIEQTVEGEKQKNGRLQDKVKNFLEKRALNEKLTLINQKKAWLCYTTEKGKAKEIARDLRLAEGRCAEKRKKYNEILEKCNRMEKELRAVDERYAKAKNLEVASKEEAWKTLKNVQAHVDRLDDLDNVLKSKLEEEESKKEELRQHVEKLDKLKNDIITFERENGTDEEARRRDEEINAELARYQREQGRLGDATVAIEDEMEPLRKELRTLKDEYRLLERRRNFRLEYLKRYEPDVYASLEWLKENRHMFRGHIYSPMVLELDVTNEKMAKYVEMLIGYRDLISFTCTTADDLNLLVKKLRIERNLRMNAICSDDEDVSQYNSDVPLSQLKDLGFFAYVRDVITGPSHIMRYLCKVYKIHCVPIGDRTVKTKCDSVPARVPIFFSEDHMFTVKISVYSGDKSISVKHLSEPRLFCVAMEAEKMETLLRREKEVAAAIHERETKLTGVKNQIQSLIERQGAARQRKQDVLAIAERRRELTVKSERIAERVASMRAEMRDPAAIAEEAAKERVALRSIIREKLEKLKKAQGKLMEASRGKRELELTHKLTKRKAKKMADAKSGHLDELREVEATLNNVKSAKREVDARCEELREAAKRLTDGIACDETAFQRFEEEFKSLKDTLEELETEMQETQMMADFLRGSNAEALQEYQKREEEIAALTASLEEKRKGVARLKDEVEELREKWLAPVKDIVDEINANFGNYFEFMGCAGEVSLVAGENKDDFDEYGIAVKVKFRNDVPLQILGRHFQSGGERAVATAIYLMSLQKLTSVPFRFVDEINQGMDATNERRVLDLLIGVTSETNTCQYFFITPKLLPNIECSDTMVVHCIFNGPNNITSGDWSLKRFLSR